MPTISVALMDAHQKPDNLIHHPIEEKFTAVQKIEAMISIERKVRDVVEKRVANPTQFLYNIPKELCIFDGYFWLPISESEQQVYATRPIYPSGEGTI
jgi:hypothetical protein